MPTILTLQGASGTARAVRLQRENTLKDRRARALPLTINTPIDAKVSVIGRKPDANDFDTARR